MSYNVSMQVQLALICELKSVDQQLPNRVVRLRIIHTQDGRLGKWVVSASNGLGCRLNCSMLPSKDVLNAKVYTAVCTFV